MLSIDSITREETKHVYSDMFIPVRPPTHKYFGAELNDGRLVKLTHYCSNHKITTVLLEVITPILQNPVW